MACSALARVVPFLLELVALQHDGFGGWVLCSKESKLHLVTAQSLLECSLVMQLM